MSRPWGKQFAHMLNHPKYLRLTVSARAAWHTLFLIALNSPTEEVLGTRADVEAILRNYGHGDGASDDVSMLIDYRLIDVRSGRNGRLKLHDWSHWQPDDPTGAKRKRAERVRGSSRDTPVTVTGQSAERHALDGDGESDGDSPIPSLPHGEGRRRRSKASNGTDAGAYDKVAIREPAADVDDVAWAEPQAVGS